MDTIRFDHNKNGQRVAYRWMNRNRWVRMNMAVAELLEATENAQVYYGPNPWKAGQFEFIRINEYTTRIVQIN